MEWAQVIAILLFICLGLFVVTALALIAILIKLTIQIRSLMKSAHAAADNLSQVAAGASGVMQLIELAKALRKKGINFIRKRERKKHE